MIIFALIFTRKDHGLCQNLSTYVFLAVFLFLPTSSVAQEAPTPNDGNSAITTQASDYQFEDNDVVFHNGSVALAGTLLRPVTSKPVPVVVFVHGAGRHTRKRHRVVAEHFARHGIAALIYDKRGVGESQGEYESRHPYENLVNDCLAAVAFLKGQPQIPKQQIGLWGESQGADIVSVAASRSKDVAFVIGVGAPVADAIGFYYRENLFRRFGLSDSMLDIAQKANLAKQDIQHLLNGDFPSVIPREIPAPEEYIHNSWAKVSQPVLAIWGELDNNVPVSESVAGLKNSLAHAGNNDWVIVIFPKANHSLGISETGALQEKWRGHVPGYFEFMTDWTLNFAKGGTRFTKKSQEGRAVESGVLARAEHYERKRWFGNVFVQGSLWLLFAAVFLANGVASAKRWLRQTSRNGQANASKQFDLLTTLMGAISVLNLILIVAFTVVVLYLIDQLRPSCPSLLVYLPVLGTLSVVGTVALLIIIVRKWRNTNWTGAKRLRCLLIAFFMVLFVPFLLYWNLVGLRF